MFRPAGLALLLSQLAGAGDVQFWNQTDVTAFENKYARWELFGVLRARDELSDAYDKRVGTLVTMSLTPRLGLGAGYHHRWVDPDGNGTSEQDRFTLGATVLLKRNPVQIESLTLYERITGVPGRPDFNRYKEKIEFERVRKGLSPLFSEEIMFTREGFMRTRTQAGIRWNFESGSKFDLVYQFESIRSDLVWAPRHVIRTTISIRKGKKVEPIFGGR